MPVALGGEAPGKADAWVPAGVNNADGAHAVERKPRVSGWLF